MIERRPPPEDGTSSGARVASLIDARWPHAIPIALLIGVVVIANLLYLTAIVDPNPLYQQSGLAVRIDPGWLSGLDTIDPNAGFTAQSLGRRAVLEWLGGRLPWWNPYEGIGVPLAGGMQSAALFPLVALIGFPSGQVAFFAVLEATAGIATYLLLRKLSLARGPAVAGAMAFALNGTFAWFRHAASNPIAFLPLLLLGIENAFDAAGRKRRSGFVVIAVALSLSVYSGFPETAFLDGLLAATWVIARVTQSEAPRRALFLAKVAAGGITGALLAAPVILAFLAYLPHADVGGHAGAFERVHLQVEALPMLVLPYVYGPIFGFAPYDGTGTLTFVWSNVGGYLTTSVILLALVGVPGRPMRALRIALVLWIALALGKTYGLTPVTIALNLVPGVSPTAFYRYAWPSVSMAAVVLASFGLNDISTGEAPRRRIAIALAFTALLTVAARVGAIPELHRLAEAPGARTWAFGSLLWGMTLVAAVGVTAMLPLHGVRTATIASLVALDACLLLIVPELSAPRSAVLDRAPVRFLRAHLGMARFYTLGPIQPNYGSYFGLASININDTPIPHAWSSYIVRRLDPGAMPMVFTGTRPQDPTTGSTAAGAFLEHLGAYEDVAVKYVVAPPGFTFPKMASADSLRLVFSDAVATIFELPNPRPYFETNGGTCTLDADDRERVRTSCSSASTLVRRELFMPGWSASIDGETVSVQRYDELFQAIEVPAGPHLVRYRYAPPHFGSMLIAFVSGLLVIGFAESRRRASREKE